jgi:large subunit ribosomal protein L25
MAKREHLKVEKREVFGKQLKKLRRDGILPGNVYGKNIASTAVQIPFKDFMTIYSAVGSTGVLDLEVEGKKHPVLIHNIAINSLTHDPIHADFFIVNLKEKISANVPIVSVNEATAVTEKTGALLQALNEIEIEALPTDLPENIEVDITSLAAVGDQITVEQIVAPEGITILSEPSAVVFKIDELVSEEAEALEAEEEAAAEAASEESVATEEAPADGDSSPKVEEKSQE